MPLLLDTCALLWLGASPHQLSDAAQDSLARSRDDVYVSAISALEIGLKSRKGKLVLPLPPRQWFASVISTFGLREIPVTSDLALHASELDWEHADPADRVIVATAIQSRCTVVTADAIIARFSGIDVIW